MVLARALGITSLTSYISRLRRPDKTTRRAQARAMESTRSEPKSEAVPPMSSARPPVATPAPTKVAADSGEDPLAQAMRALSKPALDIRQIHGDGDPNNRKLI